MCNVAYDFTFSMHQNVQSKALEIQISSMKMSADNVNRLLFPCHS
jgi:hypothetical protein